MAANEAYSRAEVRRQFRLSERQLRSWENQSLLSPAESYSFSDLIAIQTLIAVIPGIAAKLHLSTMAAGFICTLWCFVRIGAFVALWRSVARQMAKAQREAAKP